MWNGDGRVCVEAYPVEFVKQISEENPDRKFGDKDNDYSLLVDMYDSCPEKRTGYMAMHEMSKSSDFLF